MSLLLETVLARPEYPREIHISKEIWENAFWIRDGGTVEAPTMLGIPLIKNEAYRASWWSEHYADRIDLHTGDKVITIPAVYRPHSFNFERETYGSDDPGTGWLQRLL